MPNDAEELKNAWAQKSIAEALPNIRETAKGWQATLATIIGFFGAGTLIGAGETVGKLANPWNYGFGVAVGFALGFSAAATWFAAKSANMDETTVPASLSARVKLYDDTLTKARGQLESSHKFAFWAVVLLIVAMALLWYAPRDTPAPTVTEHRHDATTGEVFVPTN